MKTSLLPLFLLVFASPCLASVAIINSTLQNAVVSNPYSAVVNARHGVTPYVWALAAGALPPGVTMKPSTGTTNLYLAGTPTAAGTYSFTIAVTDCRNTVSDMPYTIIVQAAADHVVDLNWTASTSSDILGYNVYRAPDGTTWRRISVDTAATLYTDSTPADNSTYYYAVTAVDIYHHESCKTTAIKVLIP